MVKSILFISLLVLGISGAEAQNSGKVRSFQFQNMELDAALDSLLRWYEVPFIYLEKDVSGKNVNAECTECRFEEALQRVIEGQGLRWKSIGDQAVLQVDEEAFLATIAGTVRDSLTGEGVPGADVLLMTPEDPASVATNFREGEAVKVYRWCSANRFGFFSLRNVRPGDYVLVIRRISYEPITEQIRIPSSSAVIRDYAMREQGLLYKEVTVEGRRSGFSALEAASRGVYVRATPLDHNQYLLEGVRIYNPLHFAGVMSTFNEDALRDYQVIAGGVPPYYGGRIGGILDVALRDGSEQGLAGSASVGSLSSDVFLEGPVLEGSTFVISGRRGYPDVFFPRFRSDVTQSDLNSIELMGKITRRLSNHQRISLSAYFGDDSYGNSTAGPLGSRLSNSLRWGNIAANARWMGAASPALFFQASAMFTRYGFHADHRFTGNFDLETFISDYYIEDAAVRAHAEYFYDEYHTAMAGVELVRHRMSGTVNAFSSQIAPMSFDGFSPWELAVYFQDQWRLAPSVLAELGGRATSFVAKQGSFSAVDPRFSLSFSAGENLQLFSSFSAVTQFLHPYRNSGIFLYYPSIFLYPSTEDIRPSTSLQVSLGAENTLREDRYVLAVESYYRLTRNLHEFVLDTTMTGTLADGVLFGEGDIYGIDFTVRKRLGNLTGLIRYGLAWANNRFAELNNGEPFRPRFDRRHELYATATYSASERWAFGITCLVSANEFPVFTQGGSAGSPATETGQADLLARSGYEEPYDLNGGRLPGFQRLEFRVLHGFSLWGVSFRTSLRFLNGYGLVDPFVWNLSQNTDPILRWNVKVDAPPLFPLYPVFSMGIRL